MGNDKFRNIVDLSGLLQSGSFLNYARRRLFIFLDRNLVVHAGEPKTRITVKTTFLKLLVSFC